MKVTPNRGYRRHSESQRANREAILRRDAEIRAIREGMQRAPGGNLPYQG